MQTLMKHTLKINNHRADLELRHRFFSVTRGVIIGAVIGVLPWIGACSGEGNKPNNTLQNSEQSRGVISKEEGKKVFDKPTWQFGDGTFAGGVTQDQNATREGEKPKSVSGPVVAVNRETWAVLLGTFQGDDAVVQAEKFRAKAAAAGFRGAFVERRTGGAAVLTGNYNSPTEDDAKLTLQRAREAASGGERLFPSAVMAAPTISGGHGESAPLDLRNAKERLGAKAKWTLQVAIYGPLDNRPVTKEDIAEFRRLAENAAKELRRQGHDSYYFHGQARSTVCVGIFGDVTDRSPEVVALKKKLPYNLVNGQEIRKKGAKEPQESFLVEIPSEKGK